MTDRSRRWCSACCCCDTAFATRSPTSHSQTSTARGYVGPLSHSSRSSSRAMRRSQPCPPRTKPPGSGFPARRFSMRTATEEAAQPHGPRPARDPLHERDQICDLFPRSRVSHRNASVHFGGRGSSRTRPSGKWQGATNQASRVSPRRALTDRDTYCKQDWSAS